MQPKQALALDGLCHIITRYINSAVDQIILYLEFLLDHRLN